jgi:hypothetical protein
MVVRDKDETDGEVSAVPTREIAYGDEQPRDAATHEAVKPPTLMKAGEAQPGNPNGSMQKVEFPTEGKDGGSTSQPAPAKGSAPASMHTVEFPDAKPGDVGSGPDAGSAPDGGQRTQ